MDKQKKKELQEIIENKEKSLDLLKKKATGEVTNVLQGTSVEQLLYWVGQKWGPDFYKQVQDIAFADIAPISVWSSMHEKIADMQDLDEVLTQEKKEYSESDVKKTIDELLEQNIGIVEEKLKEQNAIINSKEYDLKIEGDSAKIVVSIIGSVRKLGIKKDINIEASAGLINAGSSLKIVNNANNISGFLKKLVKNVGGFDIDQEIANNIDKVPGMLKDGMSLQEGKPIESIQIKDSKLVVTFEQEKQTQYESDVLEKKALEIIETSKKETTEVLEKTPEAAGVPVSEQKDSNEVTKVIQESAPFVGTLEELVSEEEPVATKKESKEQPENGKQDGDKKLNDELKKDESAKKEKIVNEKTPVPTANKGEEVEPTGEEALVNAGSKDKKEVTKDNESPEVSLSPQQRREAIVSQFKASDAPSKEFEKYVVYYNGHKRVNAEYKNFTKKGGLLIQIDKQQFRLKKNGTWSPSPSVNLIGLDIMTQDDFKKALNVSRGSKDEESKKKKQVIKPKENKEIVETERVVLEFEGNKYVSGNFSLDNIPEEKLWTFVGSALILLGKKGNLAFYQGLHTNFPKNVSEEDVKFIDSILSYKKKHNQKDMTLGAELLALFDLASKQELVTAYNKKYSQTQSIDEFSRVLFENPKEDDQPKKEEKNVPASSPKKSDFSDWIELEGLKKNDIKKMLLVTAKGFLSDGKVRMDVYTQALKKGYISKQWMERYKNIQEHQSYLRSKGLVAGREIAGVVPRNERKYLARYVENAYKIPYELFLELPLSVEFLEGKKDLTPDMLLATMIYILSEKDGTASVDDIEKMLGNHFSAQEYRKASKKLQDDNMVEVTKFFSPKGSGKSKPTEYKVLKYSYAGVVGAGGGPDDPGGGGGGPDAPGGGGGPDDPGGPGGGGPDDPGGPGGGGPEEGPHHRDLERLDGYILLEPDGSRVFADTLTSMRLPVAVEGRPSTSVRVQLFPRGSDVPVASTMVTISNRGYSNRNAHVVMRDLPGGIYDARVINTSGTQATAPVSFEYVPIVPDHLSIQSPFKGRIQGRDVGEAIALQAKGQRNLRNGRATLTWTDTSVDPHVERVDTQVISTDTNGIVVSRNFDMAGRPHAQYTLRLDFNPIGVEGDERNASMEATHIFEYVPGLGGLEFGDPDPRTDITRRRMMLDGKGIANRTMRVRVNTPAIPAIADRVAVPAREGPWIETTVGGDGKWNIPLAGLRNGGFEVEAEMQDAGGGWTIPSIRRQYHCDLSDSEVIITDPQDNRIIDTSMSVKGTFIPRQTGGVIQVVREQSRLGRSWLGRRTGWGNQEVVREVTNVKTNKDGVFVKGISMAGLEPGDYTLRVNFGGDRNPDTGVITGGNEDIHQINYRGRDEDEAKKNDRKDGSIIPPWVSDFVKNRWDAVAGYLLGKEGNRDRDRSREGNQTEPSGNGDNNTPNNSISPEYLRGNFDISEPAENAVIEDGNINFKGNCHQGSEVRISRPRKGLGRLKAPLYFVGGRWLSRKNRWAARTGDGTNWEYNIAGFPPGKHRFRFQERRPDGSRGRLQYRNVVVPKPAKEKKSKEKANTETKEKTTTNKTTTGKKERGVLGNLRHYGTNLSEIPLFAGLGKGKEKISKMTNLSEAGWAKSVGSSVDALQKTLSNSTAGLENRLKTASDPIKKVINSPSSLIKGGK